MAKPKKSPRPKARQPRGFPDRSPADIRATEAMLAKIRAVYELYGFDPVETPMFEYTDALGKFLPDQDRPNEGVFSLQDDDEQWMSLRYDLTAPLARHVAQNINDIQLPYRTYRSGWVFRNEKPGPGRFRQFMQMDADSVGAPGPAADAEMCMMMADTMEALGVARGDYVIRVNSRKVLDGLLDAIGLGGEDQEETRLKVLRSIDKFDRVREKGVRLLLGAGRIDESTDFTPGAGLDEEQINAVCELLNLQDIGYLFVGAQHNIRGETYDSYLETWQAEEDETAPQTQDEWLETNDLVRSIGEGIEDSAVERVLERIGAGKFALNRKFRDGVEELVRIVLLANAAGYGASRVRFDLTCVRGLEYYTGAVYECELTFPVTNERGETVTFGSVAGGGRYDGLVKRFTGQDVPATGFSIGVSRLQTALKNLGKLPADDMPAPVLVTVMDREAEALAGYQKIVADLRVAGIRAEMYQGNPKQFGKQLQYADRRGAPVAIIQGADERAKGEVQVKDLVAGKKLSSEIADNQAWRAARPAQVECKVEDVVAQVRSILQAQAEDAAEPGPA